MFGRTGSYRYDPYARSSTTKPIAMRMWTGFHSDTHPKKTALGNDDRVFAYDRAICVCDGVGGCVELGLSPSAMAEHMCTHIEIELKNRLRDNSQKYDRQVQSRMKSSVSAPGGGGTSYFRVGE